MIEQIATYLLLGFIYIYINDILKYSYLNRGVVIHKQLYVFLFIALDLVERIS